MSTNAPQTYGTAERMLVHLGFVRETTAGDHLYFRHPAGAVVLLPGFPAATPLDPLHRTLIDGILKDYRLVELAEHLAG